MSGDLADISAAPANAPLDIPAQRKLYIYEVRIGWRTRRI